MATPAQSDSPKRKPLPLFGVAIIAVVGVICVCTMNVIGTPLGLVFITIAIWHGAGRLRGWQIALAAPLAVAVGIVLYGLIIYAIFSVRHH